VVSAQGEGFTCVDDVSRAAIFYLNETDIATNKEKQDRLLKLKEFVLQMQADNGYFYNFLQDNFSINKTYSRKRRHSALKYATIEEFNNQINYKNIA